MNRTGAMNASPNDVWKLLMAVAVTSLMGVISDSAVGQDAGKSTAVGPDRASNVQRRSEFLHTRKKCEQGGPVRVGFIGGSITEMNGYRPMVADWLKSRFPKAEFQFINAGISSTCSTTGAFRLSRDVLKGGMVDLLFVEFAVNDDQDAAHARDQCTRGMEGIVRQLRSHNPSADMVITYFVNPGMRELLKKGETPLPIECHEAVARHYGVSSVNLAREVAERITDGSLTWAEFGGTHPKPAGNRIAADLIAGMLDDAWKGTLPEGTTATPHDFPEEPLDPLNYGRGRLVPASDAMLEKGWSIKLPDWKAIPGSKRARFTGIDLLVAEEPGASLTLDFDGTAIGAFVVAGPDAGQLEYSIDGSEYESVDLFHRFSKGLHYPRTVMFADSLDAGPHKLKLRVSRDHNEQSRGTAARILAFAAN